MKKDLELNFWNTLLILIGINLLFILIYLVTWFLNKESFQHVSTQVAFRFLYPLLYLPVIFWMGKATGIRIKELYFLPGVSGVMSMIGIVVLARVIVLVPFAGMEDFWGSLMDSRLRIVGGTIKPVVLLFELETLILTPIVEELFFRGMVLKNFLDKYSPIKAILLSGLLFGGFHIFNLLGPASPGIYNIGIYVACGLLYGILYYKTNSLIVVTLAHMLWNALSLFTNEYIELNAANSILHLGIYISAVVAVAILIKKMETKEGQAEPVDEELLFR